MDVTADCELRGSDANGAVHHYFTNASALPFVAHTKASTNGRSGVVFDNDSHEKDFETELNFRRTLLRKATADCARYKVRLDVSTRTDPGGRATVKLETVLMHGDRRVRSIGELGVSFAVAPNN
jgi:hypothetical protein